MTIDTINLILKVIMLVLLFGLITYIFVLIIKDYLDTFRHLYHISYEFKGGFGSITINTKQKIKDGSFILEIKEYIEHENDITNIVITSIFYIGRRRVEK